jgi:hypothetical protein
MDVASGGSVRHIEVSAAKGRDKSGSEKADFVLSGIVSVAILAVAMAIGFRQAQLPSLRAFVLMLLSMSFMPSATQLPAGGFTHFYGIFDPALFCGVYLAFVYFCLSYPEGEVGRWRRRLRRMLWPYAVFALGLTMYGIAYRLGLVDRPIGLLAPAYAVVGVLLSMAGLVAGWRESSGATRSRIGWIAMSIGVAFAYFGAINVMVALGMRELVERNGYLSTIVVAAAVAGLAYAVMRHRVFDVGFAVNRALIYGAASGALLLAFGLLEWVTHKVVHFESIWLDGGLALAVFLAFHKVRDAAEHGIERLFFHEWHQREKDLRRFVTEAAHILTPSALLDAFRGALERFTGGARVALYLHQQDGSYHPHAVSSATLLGKDHPICVALRTNAAPTIVESVHGLPDTPLALPVMHGPELEALVLLGPKPGGQSYRPDELEILGVAAHSVALHLHSLEVARLRRELARAEAEANAFRSLVDSRLASAAE